MKTVCIVVGHSTLDGGCHNDELNMNEYDYNHVLAGLLAERLHRRNVRPIIMFRGSSYSGMIQDVNNTNADFAIELHCNGVSDKTVQGSETLYWHKSVASKRLAEPVQKAVAALMGENNRGIKPIEEGGRGWKFLRRTNMPAIILEPFFLSNTKSLELGLALREQLANELASAIINHITGE